MPSDPQAPSPPAAAHSPYSRWVVVSSWAVYDLANTIYSGIVVTRYFALFMEGRGAGLFWIAFANIASMFAAGLASPYAGALMDRIGCGRTLLLLSTLLCSASTALLGVAKDNLVLLISFAASNFFYNLALVFYNAFMPYLGSPQEQGRISGLGVGVGYMGMIPALYLAWVTVTHQGMAAVFPLAGALFALLALPAFLTLPRVPPAPQALHSSPLRQLAGSARAIWADRQTRLFFLGNFLCTDVLNALIYWVMVFLRNAFGMDEDSLTLYQMYLVGSNVACSLIVGWLSDRFTARKAFILSAACLAAALAAAGLAPSAEVLLWATIPLAGFALGGIWTASRKLLFQLTPPGRLGEYSGFYGLTGKVSSFTTVVYALVTDWIGGHWGHRAGVLVLALPTLAGLWLVVRLKEPGRS